MKKTCLYEKHLENNAKMVEFGGFLMPIEYTDMISEHLSVRNNVGLFDVSHMGEIICTGKEVMKFLDYVMTSCISKALPNKMTYGLLLYPTGGVVDDLMVYKFNDEEVLIVCNASNTDKDYEWLVNNKKDFDVNIENVSHLYGQLALQGPNAVSIMKKIIGVKIDDLKLFDFDYFEYKNQKILISRSGYTGEDGFEIYSTPEAIIELFSSLVNDYNVCLCGLACRDTLRFEAAMPLYGHEIDETINPISACLNYAISYDKDFIGKVSLENYKLHPTKKLVGLELEERGIARGGYEICDENTQEVIGYVTTGYLVPKSENSLFSNAIALGFVDEKHWELGTNVLIRIRRNLHKAVVRDRKFMQKKYKK